MKKYKNGKISFELQESDYILIGINLMIILIFVTFMYAMHLGIIKE